MIDFMALSPENLGQTHKALQKEFSERGWKAEVPYEGSSHYFVTRDDGKSLHIFSTTPSTATYAAGALANDKFATYGLLVDGDFPQLETVKAGSDGDLSAAIELLNRVHRVVVKPIDGGHGKGITTNVETEADLEKAVAYARKFTKNVDAAIVQTHYPHETIYDLRVVCINYEYVAAIQRVAARVFGDGQHTVRELIELENQKEDRGKPYYARLSTIDVDLAVAHLKDKANSVPAEGEEVQVLGIANYGAGGETVDVTDDLPDWLIESAQEIAKRCELPVAGIDFMISQFPEKNLSREELDPALTEVNKAPILAMHDTPTTGISRGVTKRYVDYLASI